MANRTESSGGERRDSHAWRDFSISNAGPLLLAALALYFSKDVTTLMRNASQAEARQEPNAVQQERLDAESRQFAATIVADTQGTWQELFAQTDREYIAPELAFSTGGVKSACSEADAVTGSFYCEQERKLYIDLAFLRELRQLSPASNEFAAAYVIAHEVGHHVQNLLGTAERTHQAQQQVKKAQARMLATRLELQADCYAGVWMRRSAESRPVFTDSDISRGLRAAGTVGEDRRQEAGLGYVAYDTFTHGNDELRTRWFNKGLESGEIAACDTFAARKL